MRIIVGAIFVLLASAALAQPRITTMNAGQSADVQLAVTRGASLFEAFQSESAPDPVAASRARALIKDFCPDLHYRAIAVTEGSSTAIYFIGMPPEPGDVVIGRHFRVSGSLVIPSSKACGVIPAENKSNPSKGAIATHMLSQTPNEFHVFESLAQDHPIFVMTRTAVWGVQKGAVRLLDSDLPDAAKDRSAALSNGPADKEEDLAPLIAQARDTYPDVRRRFLEGLPRGERLEVVTRLSEPHGHSERVFIRVESIEDGQIHGVIDSRLQWLTRPKTGDAYLLAEADILDWVIPKADGSEEGNVIGKYLYSQRP